MLSIIPPVFPILKHPGLIPPTYMYTVQRTCGSHMTFKARRVWLTVAGPMMATPFSLAFLIINFVLFSGIPSAMIAIVRNYTYGIIQTYDGKSEFWGVNMFIASLQVVSQYRLFIVQNLTV